MAEEYEDYSDSPESDEEFYGPTKRQESAEPSQDESLDEDEYDYDITEDQEIDASISQAQAEDALSQKESQLSAQAQAQIDELGADACAELNKANQAIADLPNKIEDTISDLKKKFEALLGKVDTPDVDPECPEFDPDKAIAKVKKVVQPALASIMPLQSVAGSIPVIGDLAGLFAEASKAKAPASDMSAEDIKKAVPAKPEVPPAIKNSIDALIDTIKTVCITLPMMLINLIFMMINVIYSKLKIITSIIPLGGMFPLSLVGTAITAVPKIMMFIQQAPAMIKDMVMGMVKDKMAEAQALGISQPPTTEQMAALAAQKAAEKGKSMAETAKENREEKLKARQGGESGEQEQSGGESGSSDSSSGAAAAGASEGSAAGEAVAQKAESAVKESAGAGGKKDSSAIQDVPEIKENPPTAEKQPTIPEVEKQYKPIMQDKMRCFIKVLPEFGLYEPVDGDSYDYDKNYHKLFGSAYISNISLSSDQLYNGKLTADEIERYDGIIKQQLEWAQKPHIDSATGYKLFPSRFYLNLDDIDCAEIKPVKSSASAATEDTKHVEQSKSSDRDFFNSLRCFSKPVADEYRLTKDSKEVKAWEETIRQGIDEKKKAAEAATREYSKNFRLKSAAHLEKNLDRFLALLDKYHCFDFKLLPNQAKLLQLDKSLDRVESGKPFNKSRL